MTKQEYTDFIRNSLPRVDQTNRYDRRQVAVAINVAVNTVFYELYMQNPKKMTKAMERYSTTATIVPSDTTLRGRYVGTLTGDVVDLPRKTGGILSIRQWDGGGIAEIETTVTNYVPVTVMEGEQFYGSEASLSGVVVGFSWSKLGQIEFWGMSAAEAAKGVEVRYLKQFKSYTDTESVILPFGQDERIIQLVREFMGLTPPVDTINDNSDIKKG